MTKYLDPKSKILTKENITNIFNLDKIVSMQTELNAYDSHLDKIRVERALMEDSRKEGKAEGIIEGEAKGKAEGIIEGEIKGKIEIIKNLISINMPIEQISQIVQLSVDEIQHYLSTK